MASAVPATSAASSISTAVATPSASSASAAAGYALPDDLPSTQNHYIASLGEIALYNPILLLAAAALLQHTAVFGILFFLRGFSPKKALDLHYLTIVFALSFVAAPIVFLVDLRIDQTKLLFFLEHEAVEFLIAIRVLAPRRFVAKRSGAIVLACWCALVGITIPVVWNERVRHAADIVAWSAFVSDFLIGTSGLALVWRWRTRVPESSFQTRKTRAEALAGLGFMLHGGYVTMSVGPIFALVLYDQVDAVYFAYAWVAVFLSAFFAVGFAVPVAGIFFSNIRWCISHRKPVFPGQAGWSEEEDLEEAAISTERMEKLAVLRHPWPHATVPPPLQPQHRPPKYRRTSSNIYYREVLKDLLAA